MTKSKIPLGLFSKKDKNDRTMYFVDRKRVKHSHFKAIQDQQKAAELQLLREQELAEKATAVEPINEVITLDKIDQLLAEIKALQIPKVTPLEARLLALSCHSETGFVAGYAEALSICNQNPMSANALLGSMSRKKLIKYESKHDSCSRVGGLLTSQAVQDARMICPTEIGLEIGRKQLQQDLALS